MGNKGLLSNMSGWSQFFFLFFLSFTGFMLAIFIISLSIDIAQMWESPREMRMALMIQSVCLFILPSLAFASLCQADTKAYLRTNTDRSPLFLLFSILLIVVIQPFIDLVGHYNQQLILPESMASIENWMRDGEESAAKTVKLLFSDKTIAGFIFNLLVIAVVAGLAEELVFRGCLQQVMQKILKNHHIAVWITAFIFSAIHFQFYGFLPRVLLGALLGYLFLWSGNIWVPIIVHTVNNAIGVIIAYLYFDTPKYEQITSYNMGQHTFYIILSVLFSVSFLFVIYKKRTTIVNLSE